MGNNLLVLVVLGTFSFLPIFVVVQEVIISFSYQPPQPLQPHLGTRVRIMKRRVRTAAMPFLLSVLVLCL